MCHLFRDVFLIGQIPNKINILFTNKHFAFIIFMGVLFVKLSRIEMIILPHDLEDEGLKTIYFTKHLY